MNAEVCTQCQADMIIEHPDMLAQVNQTWTCPKCSRRAFRKLVRCVIGATHSLHAHSESASRILGLPEREQDQVVIRGSESSTQDVLRSGGSTSALRTVRQSEPNHPDPAGHKKHEQEREAVERVLKKLNAERNADYVASPGDDARGIDVLGRSRTLPELRFQVTKADHHIWRDLASPAASSTWQGTEADLLLRLWEAVESKRRAASPDVILILDGWGITSPGTIQAFRKAYACRLAAAGFEAVWYSGRGPGGVVERLA